MSGLAARGEPLRVLDFADRLGFRLAAGNLPPETMDLLSQPRLHMRGDNLDPGHCSRKGGNRGFDIASWLCRTLLPVQVGGSATSDVRYRVEQVGGEGEGGEPLRRFDAGRPGEVNVFEPFAAGIVIQLDRRESLPTGDRRYTASYPVDVEKIRALDWSFSGLAPAEAASFVVREVDLDGDVRPALYAPAGSRFELALVVPERARLQVGLGVLETAWRQSDGVEFRISLRGTSGTLHPVETRVLDPRGRPGDRRWLEIDADLGPALEALAAGPDDELSLVLETGPGPGGGWAWDYAAFANPVIRRSDAQGTPVVLIDIDTLRADHLDVYGYPRSTAPVLSDFAREAVVFEQAVAPAPWTLPSQMSILTGLRPASHGVQTLESRLPAEVATLAAELRRHGYSTRAINDGGAVAHEFGFHRGFDSYWEHRGHRGAQPDFLSESMRRFHLYYATRIPRKSFLFFHTYETHFPYAPPAKILALFDRGYTGTIFERFDSFLGTGAPFRFDQRDLDHLVARYDGEIRYSDAAVGTLLSLLDARGLSSDALVVVLSDHGEEFREHGSFGHGDTLYEEMVRVPLMIRFPSGTVPSQRIPQQVELVDVMPTILDFLGLPLPAGLDGRSLMPLVRGEPFAERLAITDALAVGASVRSRHHKLIRTADGDRFYDLQEDPGEQRDLYDAGDPVAARYQQALEAYRARARGLREAGELSKELESKLRELGYVD